MDHGAILPCRFPSLRQVPAYPRYINEIFERCLDLYLCPRQKKDRVCVSIIFPVISSVWANICSNEICLFVCKTRILNYVLIFLFWWVKLYLNFVVVSLRNISIQRHSYQSFLNRKTCNPIHQLVIWNTGAMMELLPQCPLTTLENGLLQVRNLRWVSVP